MSEFTQLVADTLAAPLAAARRQPAGTAVGYVGAEVPVEVLRAGSAFAVRLPAPVLDATPRADALLESSFMPAVRSIAEQYLRGEFDFLRALILPRSNDSAQRLYYYLCEHQRMGHHGPQLLIYDLAKIPRASSLEHTEAATRDLSQALGASAAGLDVAVALRNQRAQLLRRAGQLRLAGRLRGSEMERLVRAAGFSEPAHFDRLLGAWLDARSGQPVQPGPRLLLVGSAPPDERLHRTVEAAGGNVVAESGEHGGSEARHLEPVDSAVGLAAAYHRSAFGPRAFTDRAGQLRQLAVTAGVDGVIFWLVEEEDAFIWDVPSQRAALADSGVPQLVLSRRRWDAADDTHERIREFMGTLRGGTR